MLHSSKPSLFKVKYAAHLFRLQLYSVGFIHRAVSGHGWCSEESLLLVFAVCVGVLCLEHLSLFIHVEYTESYTAEICRSFGSEDVKPDHRKRYFHQQRW